MLGCLLRAVARQSGETFAGPGRMFRPVNAPPPDTRPRYPFGELLRAYRLEAELSQEALAEVARISPETIGALERGRRKAPQRDTLALIVAGLKLSPEKSR